MKWKVSDKPVGRYRSVEKRAWPYAYYDDGAIAARIECDDAYVPSAIKDGQEFTLWLYIAVYDGSGRWVWKKRATPFKTIEECKNELARFVDKYPHLTGGHK